MIEQVTHALIVAVREYPANAPPREGAAGVRQFRKIGGSKTLLRIAAELASVRDGQVGRVEIDEVSSLRELEGFSKIHPLNRCALQRTTHRPQFTDTHATKGAGAPWDIEDAPAVNTPKTVPARLIQVDEPSSACHSAGWNLCSDRAVVPSRDAARVGCECSEESARLVPHHEPCVHKLVVQISQIASPPRTVAHLEEHRPASEERLMVILEPFGNKWEQSTQKPGLASCPLQERAGIVRLPQSEVE